MLLQMRMILAVVVLQLFHIVADSPCTAFSSPSPPPPPSKRIRHKLNNNLNLISRTIPISPPTLPHVTIYELASPSSLVSAWYEKPTTESQSSSSSDHDPFGVVAWPGSIRASLELVRHRNDVVGKVVLVLGAGCGVEAHVAATLGAERVICLDCNVMTLDILGYGADVAGFGDVIEGRDFDLFSTTPLPPADIVIAADVLYDEALASQIGKRCLEVLTTNTNTNTNTNTSSFSNKSKQPTALVVTDSQNFHGTDFLDTVNHNLPPDHIRLEWKEEVMEGFVGSGVVVEEDQTYDVKVRTLSTGWVG